MRKHLVILLSAAIAIACNNNRESTSTTNSASTLSNNNSTQNQQTEFCFQRVEGNTNQDTSVINLVFKADKVTGTFNHTPHEKDSRKGTLSGSRDGDIIKTVWSFMQEGIKDTLSVEFKLSENELYQKTFGIDQQTGRQKITDTSTFSIRYQKIDCSQLK